MQETYLFFPQEFYSKYLSIINGVHFTQREIEIIACLLNARGTSKISFFLEINPRTVETHIRNIRSKLKCNAREGIIDFIEASHKLPLLRKYYSLLRTHLAFENTLKEISKLKHEKVPVCLIVPWNDKGHKNYLIPQLKTHLECVGINVSITTRKKSAGYVIYVFSKLPEEKETSLLLQKINQRSEKVFFFLQGRDNQKKISKELEGFDVVDLSKHPNYYFSFFPILKKLIPDLNFEKNIDDFTKKHELIREASTSQVSFKENKLDDKKVSVSQQTASLLYKNKLIFLSALLLTVGLFVCGSLAFLWNQNKERFFIRSELVIPTESAFLNRGELIAQLDKKFKSQRDIQTVALVGIGGAGKTTLARQYVLSQKPSLVWEINAETKNSLQESFESLAYALSQTDKNKKLFKEFQKIKDPHEKEEKILLFVREKLKVHPHWFLIYDNVEKVTDIQKYFPHDSHVWGTGKIIITTRDSHIQNNSYINQALQIGELDKNQKLSFFLNIMNRGTARQFTPAQKEEAKKFLEEIPPFPLDILIAAYYLKATNVSYSKYLENFNHYTKDFASVQENILKGAGDYIKTRYAIITLSLQQLMAAHKDFVDLLLLISFLDSQNIPRELLDKYKGNTVVDNFIYNLKKYSLITNESSSAIGSTISIHRKTQELILSYLVKKLALEKNSSLFLQISDIIDSYTNELIDKKNYIKIKPLVSHYETFLSHESLLSKDIKGLISGVLGSIYFHVGDDAKAKPFLEESIRNLDKNRKKNYPKIAKSLINLGNVYREFANYGKAQEVLEEGLSIYKKYLPENYDGIARALRYLGKVYRSLGDYEKAIKVLEESLMLYKQNLPRDNAKLAVVLVYLGNIYREKGYFKKARQSVEEGLEIFKKHSPENHIEIARTLMYLGNIYRELGFFEKAKISLEESLMFYKKIFGKDNIRISSVLSSLSNVYRDLGNFEKAKSLIEKSLLIYKNNYSDDHIEVIRTFLFLGNIYTDLGNFEKAKSLIEKSLIIHERHYGKEHIETARVLRSMGQTYLLEGRFENAENLFHKTLKIFQRNKHPQVHQSLESLAELHLQKSVHAGNQGDKTQTQNLKTQAISYLTQALEVVKAHFPEDSPHIARIESKIKAISE